MLGRVQIHSLARHYFGAAGLILKMLRTRPFPELGRTSPLPCMPQACSGRSDAAYRARASRGGKLSILTSLPFAPQTRMK